MRQADVAVVGAGPAGCAAALAAAEAGARVILIDEQPDLGGHLRWRVAPIQGLEPDLDGLPGIRVAASLAARVTAAGVEVVREAVAWGLFEGNVLGVAAGESSFTVEAQRVVVATGSTDQVLPFPGWDLPGVMTARAVQIFLHLHRVLPGQRVVVVGSGPEAEEVAADIEAAGAEVVARVPGIAGLAASGGDEVEAVEIDGLSHAADTVVLALGRQPDPELALQARVETVYDDAAGGHVLRRDPSLATSQPGLYVVGDAAGIVPVAEAMAEGRLAGLAAAGAPEADIAAARGALEDLRAAAERAPAEVLHSGEPDATVCLCRCEEVGVEAVHQAIAEGAATLDDIKRRTRVGMGLCQGIYCLPAVAALLRDAAGTPPEAIVPMTARPPARALPLALLAALEE